MNAFDAMIKLLNRDKEEIFKLVVKRYLAGDMPENEFKKTLKADPVLEKVYRDMINN